MVGIKKINLSKGKASHSLQLGFSFPFMIETVSNDGNPINTLQKPMVYLSYQ